jgi:hypothetical protein
MNASLLLRILAFVCFVIAVFLILAKTSTEVGGIFVPLGLALWVLATILGGVNIGSRTT